MADSLGFHSLTDETTADLPVEGDLPPWLSGSLIRNGPGAFELGGASVDHWFDGLAMLHRYTFDGGVSYRNRFLRTDTYEAATDGEFTGGFATGESTLRDRLRNLFGEPYDNTNVIAERVGDRYVALTETPRWVEFDPRSLETVGHHQYDGPAPAGQITSAHPRRDPDTGSLVTVETEFGRTSHYHVLEIAGLERRDPIASIPVAEPAYMHSFALTPGYVVLTEFPFVVNPLSFLKPGRQGPFIENYEWKPDRGTRFLVVDREEGTVVADPRTDSFFGFHHANAYERDGELVIDLETVPDPTMLETLSLSSLRAGDLDVLGGRLDRFRLDPRADDPAIDRERLYDGTALPTVSPERWTRPHRFVYAQHTEQPVTEWPTGVVKIDADRGTATVATAGGDHFGEPVFVPRPGGDREDDGVVLVVALDTDAERSRLVLLDGETLEERARAELPHAVPFDFHGRFFPELTW